MSALVDHVLGPEAGKSLAAGIAAAGTVVVVPGAALAGAYRVRLAATLGAERDVDPFDRVGEVARDVETDRALRETEAAGIERGGRDASASGQQIGIRDRGIQRRADDVVHPVATVRGVQIHAPAGEARTAAHGEGSILQLRADARREAVRIHLRRIAGRNMRALSARRIDAPCGRRRWHRPRAPACRREDRSRRARLCRPRCLHTACGSPRAASPISRCGRHGSSLRFEGSRCRYSAVRFMKPRSPTPKP